MSEVLYRKYRPKSFDEVVGQNHIVTILSEQMKKDEVSHAYLFAGPRGTGKTTVARIFARGINRVEISERDDISDIIEIDAASNRGIDEIRDLKSKIDFIPSHSKYKVYIIDEVHMLTKEAFNALLKTIEEPPSHIVFIFATTEPHKLPNTILSRVMRFDFRLGTKQELLTNIQRILKAEKYSFDDEAIELIVRFARGSFRDSLSILEKIVRGSDTKSFSLNKVANILGYSEYETVDKFIGFIKEKDLSEALLMLDLVENRGVDLNQFVYQVIDELREIMFSLIKGEKVDWNLLNISQAIRELSQAIQNSKSTIIPSLPFEIALMKLMLDENIIIEKKAKNTLVTKQMNDTKFIQQIKDKGGGNNKGEYEKIEQDCLGGKWDRVIEGVRPFNHHLSAFLVNSVPVQVGNVICINVPYELHRKKLDTKAGREVVRAQIRKVFGEGCDYSVKVDIKLLSNLRKSVVNSVEDDNEAVVNKVFKVGDK